MPIPAQRLVAAALGIGACFCLDFLTACGLFLALSSILVWEHAGSRQQLAERERRIDLAQAEAERTDKAKGRAAGQQALDRMRRKAPAPSELFRPGGTLPRKRKYDLREIDDGTE